ncbi:MAG: flagellar basal body-associated FliL family protein [Nitrospiraceae bacterium]|nr:flagellar basal body-associated FliL family protein [Nitrospiraceae bacterium]
MPEEKPREEAGEEQDSGAQTKPGKKKMLVKLGVIALAVVVLAGGGFFAYQKFLAKGSRGNAKHDRPAEKSVLVPMEPFILNLSDPGRFLKLTMQLEVEDQADAPLIDGLKAQIRDAVITLISSKSVDDLSTAEGKMQLKDDLVLRVNQVAGKPVVKNVYFTEFIMQ